VENKAAEIHEIKSSTGADQQGFLNASQQVIDKTIERTNETDSRAKWLNGILDFSGGKAIVGGLGRTGIPE